MAVFRHIIKTSNDPKFKSIACGSDSKHESKSFSYLKVRVPYLTMDEHHMLQTAIDVQYFEKVILLQVENIGYRIYSIYIKKNCSTGENSEQLSNMTNSVDEVLKEVDSENRELYIKVFAVERMSIEENSETVVSSTKNQISKISQVDCFTSKTRYTFDEILTEINNFNKEMFLQNN